MQLWSAWWNVLWLLRPAFSRVRTFLWFATAVAGLTVRTDLMGVTSIVRALNLHERFYGTLLEFFHSPAVKLDQLAPMWTQIVLRVFPGVLRVNGRLVLVGDGIQVSKRGKKMPAVKTLNTPLLRDGDARVFSWDFPFKANCARVEVNMPAGDKSWASDFRRVFGYFPHQTHDI